MASLIFISSLVEWVERKKTEWTTSRKSGDLFVIQLRCNWLNDGLHGKLTVRLASEIFKSTSAFDNFHWLWGGSFCIIGGKPAKITVLKVTLDNLARRWYRRRKWTEKHRKVEARLLGVLEPHCEKGKLKNRTIASKWILPHSRTAEKTSIEWHCESEKCRVEIPKLEKSCKALKATHQLNTHTHQTQLGKRKSAKRGKLIFLSSLSQRQTHGFWSIISLSSRLSGLPDIRNHSGLEVVELWQIVWVSCCSRPEVLLIPSRCFPEASQAVHTSLN